MGGRRALGVIVTALVAAGVMPASAAAAYTGSAGASAGTAVSIQQAGIAELMASYGADRPDLIGSGWWQAAISQSTLETYEQATGDPSYYPDIASTYAKYRTGQADHDNLPDFEDDYMDDTAWWGLAWLQAYVLTGDTQYLQVAEDDAAFDHKYWVTDSKDCGGGGGILWNRTYPNSMGTIANALFIELTAGLHNVIPRDTKYLGWAEDDWSWLSRTHLITSSHLVLNGYIVTSGRKHTCELSKPYWSYNAGAVIAGLAELYRATGSASLLTEAEEIADATIKYMAPGGVLAENCEPSKCNSDQVSYKGIFVRDLKILATTAGTSQYQAFFQAQAASIESSDTTAGHESGLVWTGPAPKCPADITSANPCSTYTQASAVDALVAALGPPTARPAAAISSDGTLRVFARSSGGSIAEDSLRPGSATWSGLTSLGGGSAGDPAAVSDGRSFWVFATSPSGSLLADSLAGGSVAWSGWVSLGNPSMHLIGTPAAIVDGGGAIRVFVRGANGDLYQDIGSGNAWSGFTSLGGTWPFDVAATAGAKGYVHLFGVGTSGALYQDQLAPGRSTWSGWTSLGGTVTGVPAAFPIRAYARDTSGALEEYTPAANGAYTADSRGGNWPFDVAAVAVGAGSLHLFAVGTAGQMYWQRQSPAFRTWSDWTSLGGSLTGVPAAVASKGTVYLFATAAGGSVEENQLRGGSGTWSGWSSLGSE
jgi:predicted alpha-1,6-mannanase (GH76 family)